MSNKLADIYLKLQSMGDSYTNIINQSLVNESSIISKLQKKSIIDNRMFGAKLLMSTHTGSNFITNNLVTCMETMYTNNLINKNYIVQLTLVNSVLLLPIKD